MNQYKAGKPRFSSHYGYEVVDILERKLFLSFLPYWGIHDTIRNAGQVDEVVSYLNNPEKRKQIIQEIVKVVSTPSAQKFSESSFEFTIYDMRSALVNGQTFGILFQRGELDKVKTFDEWYAYHCVYKKVFTTEAWWIKRTKNEVLVAYAFKDIQKAFNEGFAEGEMQEAGLEAMHSFYEWISYYDLGRQKDSTND